MRATGSTLHARGHRFTHTHYAQEVQFRYISREHNAHSNCYYVPNFNVDFYITRVRVRVFALHDSATRYFTNTRWNIRCDKYFPSSVIEIYVWLSYTLLYPPPKKKQRLVLAMSCINVWGDRSVRADLGQKRRIKKKKNLHRVRTLFRQWDLACLRDDYGNVKCLLFLDRNDIRTYGMGVHHTFRVVGHSSFSLEISPPSLVIIWLVKTNIFDFIKIFESKQLLLPQWNKLLLLSLRLSTFFKLIF